MALNSDNLNPGGSPASPGPTVWTYISSDTVAAIETDGYFDAVDDLMTTGDFLLAHSTATTGGGQKIYLLTVTANDVALSTGTSIS